MDTEVIRGIPRSRRRCPRTDIAVPATLRLLGSDGALIGGGRGVISNISDEGIQLSQIELHDGGFPACAHFVVIIPLAAEHGSVWIKACVVRAQFRAGSAEIGAYIVASSGGLDKLTA